MPKSATSDARAAYWREQIEAWRRCGQSQQAYCQANDLSYPRFIYWRRKLTGADAGGERRRSSAFVPVAWPVPRASAELSLVLPSGLELRGITAENLSVVEQLLSALS